MSKNPKQKAIFEAAYYYGAKESLKALIDAIEAPPATGSFDEVMRLLRMAHAALEVEFLIYQARLIAMRGAPDVLL